MFITFKDTVTYFIYLCINNECISRLIILSESRTSFQGLSLF